MHVSFHTLGWSLAWDETCCLDVVVLFFFPSNPLHPWSDTRGDASCVPATSCSSSFSGCPPGFLYGLSVVRRHISPTHSLFTYLQATYTATQSTGAKKLWIICDISCKIPACPIYATSRLPNHPRPELMVFPTNTRLLVCTGKIQLLSHAELREHRRHWSRRQHTWSWAYVIVLQSYVREHAYDIRPSEHIRNKCKCACSVPEWNPGHAHTHTHTFTKIPRNIYMNIMNIYI